MTESRRTYTEVLDALKRMSRIGEMEGAYTRAWHLDFAIEYMTKMETVLTELRNSFSLDSFENFRSEEVDLIDNLFREMKIGIYLPPRRSDQLDLEDISND
jgi:hypothetical protein